jgi:predicted ATP-dependent serine protease
VVYWSAEERLGPSVGERLSRLGVHRPDFFVVGRGGTLDDMTRYARKNKVSSVVIDSIQATAVIPGDLRSLISFCRLSALIVTSQVTKAGDMRGSRELEHEADVIVYVDGGLWTVQKTRYGETGAAGKVAFDARSSRGENVPVPE